MAQQTAVTYGAGRSEAVYVTPEVTYGTAVDHAGTDHVPSDAEAQLTVEFPRNPNLDKKETLSLHEVYDDGMWATAFTFPDTDFKPSGVVATAPDMADMLEAVMGSQIDGHATQPVFSGTPTTTSGTVDDATHAYVGQLVRFEGNTTTALANKCRFLTAVNQGTGAITWAPAVSVAPASGDKLNLGFGWAQTTVNEKSVSVFQEFALLVQAASGVSLNTCKVTIAGNGHVKIGFSGPGCGLYSFVGQAVTNGTCLIADDHVHVATGQGKRFRVTTDTPPLYIRIEDEILKVTAVSGDILTVSRAQKSTSAAEHATSSVIVPWRPTRTSAGSPVFTTKGETLLDGTAFKVNQAVFDIDNGFAPRDPNVGEQWTVEPPHRAGMNPFKVNLNLSGKLTKEYLAQFGGALEAGTHDFLAVCGNAANCYFGVYVLKWKPNINAPTGGDDEMMLPQDGECMETAGLDVIYIGTV